MAEIILNSLSKTYPSGTVGIKGVNMKIESGELTVITGGQASGKSALLRSVCGLDDITSGEAYIDGSSINGVLPKDRDIAVVMQNIPLYPHLTVFDNLAYSLNLRKLPKEEIEARVNEAAAIMGLESVLLKKPKNLSSLERQRAFLARAIARRTKIIMIDEPFKGLDDGLKNEMRTEIVKLSKRLGVNFIVAMRSSSDALVMADKIAYFEKGELVQYAAPAEIYDRPATVGVATYFGRPKINILDGVIENGNFVGADITIPVGERAKDYDGTGKKVYLAVRGEDVVAGETFEAKVLAANKEYGTFAAEITPDYLLTVFADVLPKEGEIVKLSFKDSGVLLYDFETEKLIG